MILTERHRKRLIPGDCFFGRYIENSLLYNDHSRSPNIRYCPWWLRAWREGSECALQAVLEQGSAWPYKAEIQVGNPTTPDGQQLRISSITPSFISFREQGQGNTDDLRNRDFRDELERRERETSGKSSKPAIPAVVRRAIEANSSGSSSSKRQKTDSAANLDADDPVDNDSSSDSDSDDSDDDTAALLAELNKIKKERVVETEQKEAVRAKEEERIRMENILSGNPLINYSAAPRGEMKIKRRWDDDVVFKNCARSELDKKAPSFINDSLRSDFHKKFMEKYIK